MTLVLKEIRKPLAVTLSLAMSWTAMSGIAQAEGGQLSLLVWEGYADPSFVKEFEASLGLHGPGNLCRIE